MNRMINDFLADCMSTESEIKNKILILRKRGYSLDVSDDCVLYNNYFAWGLDSDDFIRFFNIPIDNMINKLYSMDSAENFPVDRKEYRKWGDWFGGNTVYGFKVRINSLDPFVARFVRALALIGVFTNYSCDGWHFNNLKNQLCVEFTERYSLLWFCSLLKCDDELNTIILDYNVRDCIFFIKLEEKKLSDIYSKIDLISEVLYRKRKYFHYCKSFVKEYYKGIPKSNKTDDELLIMFEEGLKKAIESSNNDIVFRSKELELYYWEKLNEERIYDFIKGI